MKKQFFLFFTLLLFLVEVNADNYPKNTGIDILHYRFELILSDDENLIKGSSTINILFKKKNNGY